MQLVFLSYFKPHRRKKSLSDDLRLKLPNPTDKGEEVDEKSSLQYLMVNNPVFTKILFYSLE
jgi:hypothetical protein